EWVSLELAANFVEYLPIGRPTTGVNRLTSRVKAEEELWNKVTDEMFHLDQLVERDKHLRQYSKYIKDIFGIKIVCEDEETCLRVHDKLKSMTIAETDWESLAGSDTISGCDHEWTSSDRVLEFIETKNYLTCAPSEMKRTGWRALKSVVK